MKETHVDNKPKLKKLHIGDEISLVPETFSNTENIIDGHSPKKAMKCTVVYIHPKGRFITAAFKFDGGVIKESFKMSELEGYEL